jgi:phosphate-selective porin
MLGRRLFLKRSETHFNRSFTLAACLIGASVALAGKPVRAQDSEIELLRKQLADMQARLDKLEAAQNEAKAAAATAATAAATAATAAKTATPPATSASKLPIVFGGLAQLDPTVYFSQDRTTGQQADTFRIRRGEFRVTAPSITSRVSGSIMFDLGKTNNTTNAGSVLQEIFASYNIDKSPKAPKFVDIGQFKPGFGYESDQVSAGALQLTERALFYGFRDLAASSVPTIDPDGSGPLPAIPSGLPAARPGGGLGDARDQGARLRGSFAKDTIAYNVGVFNGIGERQNSLAGGDPKAYVARLMYRPRPTGLQIGVSGLRANTRGDIVGTALNRQGYGTFLVYKKRKFTLLSEYAHFDSEQRANRAFYRNDTGYYVGIGYLVHPKIELVGRYDVLKLDTRSGSSAAAVATRTTETTLGANYFIKGNNAKIQVNLVDVQDDLAETSTGSGLQLRTNFQVGF